jgi:DNA-binding transcriptional MerR regulator
MGEQLTIGTLARRTAVPATTIRFYEATGVLPPPTRTTAGYRLYSMTDVRRLQLVRRARILGLSLPLVRQLVDQAFASECAAFGEQLLERITAQRLAIRQQIEELHAVQSDLDALEQHLRHARAHLLPGQRAADCGGCPLLDAADEGNRGADSADFARLAAEPARRGVREDGREGDQ